MPTNTFTSPRCIASIVPTVSSPCSRVGSIPQAAPKRARNGSRGRWSMPHVRVPWTLLCPRTGDGPAPSRPMLPRSAPQVDDLADRVHAVLLLRDAEAPADDRPVRVAVQARHLTHRRLRDARGLLQFAPRGCGAHAPVVLEALRVMFKERVV